MRKYFLTVILLVAGFLSGTVAAQTVSGKVTDTAQHPVDGATIVLQMPDSTFIDAAITDSTGTFTLNHRPERYRLIFQHILYNTVEKEGTGSDAGVTVMKEKDYALGEVVVKGERPLVKVEGSRLTYDMPQLTANKLVTNAYEAVKQLPGIIEQDGTLTLAGAGAVSLILNGKPSSMTYEQLAALLKSMPASQVERAEVMYSAPPQYHVRGAAVNIVLKGYKPGEGGLQGEVNANYIQMDEAGGNGGVTLNFTSPKFDVDFMYNINDRYSRQSMDFAALHTVDGKTHDIRLYNNAEGRTVSHMLRTGGTYKFDSENQLGLTYTTDFAPDQKNFIQAWGNISNSANDNRDKNQMHNVALSYASGFGLKAGADYTYYSSQGTQDFADTDGNGGKTAFVSDSEQRIDRWKAYADQSHTLPKGWTLNYGASFTYVNDRNTQHYNLPEMSGENTNSRIDEYTYNMYAGFDKSFGQQWSLSASAAIEYYQMKNYKKWAVYPAMQLSYVHAPAHIFQLSFSSDKTYPDYWTLSGTREYLNGYQESVGNAFLKPYTNYNATLAYILKSKYIFQISYSYQPDYFMQMVYLESDRLKSVYDYQNWDYMKTLTFTAVIPIRAGRWWDSQLSLHAQLKHDKASNYHDAPFDNKRWAGIGNWTNTFTLSQRPNIKLEVSAFGQAGAIQGSYRIDPIGTVDAALRYTFAGDKAMIQVKGTDIFNGFNHLKTKVRNGAQHLDMGVSNYQRGLTIAFSYKFGGYKKKETKEVDTSRFGL